MKSGALSRRAGALKKSNMEKALYLISGDFGETEYSKVVQGYSFFLFKLFV